MDCKDKAEEFVQYLMDYKAGRIAQQEEPQHSFFLKLADNLENTRMMYIAHCKFQEGSLEGTLELEEFLKSK